MKTKKLFVLICNGGDGSYYPKFTFDEKWIERMNEKDEAGELDEPWSDGDGFHYDVLKVPADVTLWTGRKRSDLSGKRRALDGGLLSTPPEVGARARYPRRDPAAATFAQ